MRPLGPYELVTGGPRLQRAEDEKREASTARGGPRVLRVCLDSAAREQGQQTAPGACEQGGRNCGVCQWSLEHSARISLEPSRRCDIQPRDLPVATRHHRRLWQCKPRFCQRPSSSSWNVTRTCSAVSHCFDGTKLRGRNSRLGMLASSSW